MEGIQRLSHYCQRIKKLLKPLWMKKELRTARWKSYCQSETVEVEEEETQEGKPCTDVIKDSEMELLMTVLEEEIEAENARNISQEIEKMVRETVLMQEEPKPAEKGEPAQETREQVPARDKGKEPADTEEDSESERTVTDSSSEGDSSGDSFTEVMKIPAKEKKDTPKSQSKYPFGKSKKQKVEVVVYRRRSSRLGFSKTKPDPKNTKDNPYLLEEESEEDKEGSKGAFT